MSLTDDLLASSDVALAVASTLETQLGDDSVLTVGAPRASIAEVLRAEPTRVVVLHFATADEHEGLVALVALESFAEALERAASDELLLTAAGAALEVGARAIAALAPLDGEPYGGELWDLERLNEDEAESQSAIFPILEGAEPVACFAVYVRTAHSSSTADPPYPQSASSDASASPDLGSSFVLAEVEMGVTAELGRCRMTMRELLSVTPGAVIDLDRSAGAPVDVLVNGTLIARGEVVVIDEEFGIRISEILRHATAAP